jgi:hypothetical protein
MQQSVLETIVTAKDNDRYEPCILRQHARTRPITADMVMRQLVRQEMTPGPRQQSKRAVEPHSNAEDLNLLTIPWFAYGRAVATSVPAAVCHQSHDCCGRAPLG